VNLFDDDDGRSGAVGLRTVNVSVRVSSLFVSGSVEDVFHDDALYNSCANISSDAPTMDPTRELEVSSVTKRPTMADATESEVTGEPTLPTMSRDVRSREPSMAPSIVQTISSTTTSTTSDESVADSEDGDGVVAVGVGDGQNSNSVVTGANLSGETMLWLIGIPATAILICLVLSCVVNVYFCKKEIGDTEYSDEEGDESSQLDDDDIEDIDVSDTEDLLDTDAYDYDRSAYDI